MTRYNPDKEIQEARAVIDALREHFHDNGEHPFCVQEILQILQTVDVLFTQNNQMKEFLRKSKDRNALLVLSGLYVPGEKT